MTFKHLSRDQVARRLALAIPPGSFINLGIGLPTMVAGHVPPEHGVILHSENGILNFGGRPPPGEEDMDLASGARAIWVIMEHRTRDGQPKLVERCRYPLTASAVVTRVFTDLGVFAVTPAGFVVEEMVDGLDLPALQAMTGAPLIAR